MQNGLAGNWPIGESGNGMSINAYQVPMSSANYASTAPGGGSWSMDSGNGLGNGVGFTGGTTKSTGGGFMDGMGGAMKTGLGAMEGLAAMWQAWNAQKMAKQAKKQFGYEVASGNRNLSNMALAYNGDLNQRTRDGLALNGITSQDNPEYQARMSNAKSRYVDGSAITA